MDDATPDLERTEGEGGQPVETPDPALDQTALEAAVGHTNEVPVFSAPAGTVLFHAPRWVEQDGEVFISFELTYRAGGWPEHSPGKLAGLLGKGG